VLTDAALTSSERLIRRIPAFPWLCVAAAFAALAAGTACADDPPRGPAPANDLSPAVVQALTPLLAEWITRSRSAAVRQGVAEIPAPIRSTLAGYVPEAALSRVRWRTGGGDELSLQKNLFAFGDVQAITLDDVIVFSDEKEALTDPKLWAHELKHVMQFSEWGIAGFATRYLRDYETVERDADDYRWDFMKLRGLVPPPAPVR